MRFLSKTENALIYCQRSLEIKKKLYGTEEHLKIVDNLFNIALIYKNLKQYNDSLSMFEKSLAITRNLLKTNISPLVAKHIINIGSVYEALDKFDKALDSYEEAYAIQVELNANDDYSTVQVIKSKMGFIFQKLLFKPGHEQYDSQYD